MKAYDIEVSLGADGIFLTQDSGHDEQSDIVLTPEQIPLVVEWLIAAAKSHPLAEIPKD